MQSAFFAMPVVVNVHCMSGNVLTINMHWNDTILSVKRQIKEELDVSCTCQSLILGAETVPDGIPLCLVATLPKWYLLGDMAPVPKWLPRELDLSLVVSTSPCAYCLKPSHKLSLCSSCRNVRYCSGPCHLQDWPRHKPECVIQRTHMI